MRRSDSLKGLFPSDQLALLQGRQLSGPADTELPTPGNLAGARAGWAMV